VAKRIVLSSLLAISFLAGDVAQSQRMRNSPPPDDIWEMLETYQNSDLGHQSDAQFPPGTTFLAMTVWGHRDCHNAVPHGRIMCGNAPIIREFIDGSTFCPSNLDHRLTAVWPTYYRNYTLAGYGKTETESVAHMRQICADTGIANCKGPVRNPQRSNLCGACMHVNLQALGYRAGNKTKYCQSHHFNGYMPFANRPDLKDEGYCYVGPNCGAVKVAYR
jgi:hypothetical protein